jgi:hypothetical protein
MAGGQLAPGRPNQWRSKLREIRVKRRTERWEQGKLDGVLTAGRAEEEQPDLATNGDGGQQLSSGHDSALVAIWPWEETVGVRLDVPQLLVIMARSRSALEQRIDDEHDTRRRTCSS